MKDSDELDLDIYIDILEKTLERCDIPEDNDSYFLQMNISGKYLRLLEGSDLDNSDYQTFKHRLLTAAGFTSRGAALRLFQDCPKPPKEVKGAFTIASKKCHIKRYYFQACCCESMTTVDKGCVNYLDCRDPQTETQFIDALQTYYSSNTEVQADSFHRIISKGKCHGANTARRLVITQMTAGGSRNPSIPNHLITMMVLQWRTND